MAVHCVRMLVPYILLFYLCTLCAGEVYKYHEAVYSGEHFDAITLNSYGRFSRAAVLVLYSEECRDTFSKFAVLRTRLPSSHYLVYSTYDHLAAPVHTWYTFRERDQLEKRYGITDCFKVLFFPAGSTPKHKPFMWDPATDPDFTQWAWSRIQVPVKVSNQLETSLKVQYLGKGPQLDSIILKPQEEREIPVYTSYHLTMTEEKSGTFKRGGIVSGPRLTFTATNSHPQQKDFKTATEFLKVLETDDVKLSKDFSEFIHEQAKRSLINIKQPMMFPNFTETGYKKTQMPEDLFKLIKEFFLETRQFAREESNSKIENINNGERPCTMVYLQLQQHVANTIPMLIQRHLEEWCDCALELTELYGVREYHTGHRLQNHVDRTNGHIISAIFHIAKDLDGQEDWPLEIINYKGLRQQIFLEPGQMLMYESGKLIHGRPTPFQGRGYANAFIHFKPKAWTLTSNATYIIDTERGMVEDIFNPFTELTITKPLFLSPRKSVKDEL